jgi:3-hydroxyacyl-CoA dehydrogenase
MTFAMAQDGVVDPAAVDKRGRTGCGLLAGGFTSAALNNSDWR